MLAEELGEAALIHVWGRQVTPAVYNHRLPGDGSLVVIYSSFHTLLTHDSFTAKKLPIHFLNTSDDGELTTY